MIAVKPAVTVGVCVRNSASTIREAIESIINQDFSHELMEIIFVDDGSEDDTLSIIQEYVLMMDIAAKVFHISWQGLGAARNFVVENAGGKYIVWVDGDMVLPEDHVRKQVEFMEKNPKVGIAKARYGAYNSKEDVVGFLENIPYVIDDFRCGSDFGEKLPGTGGAVFRVNAVRQVGGFDSSLRGVGEDQEVALRIKNAGWLIRRSDTFFYERHRRTWGSLWKKYFWYGYGNWHLYQKNRGLFSLSKMNPLAGFVSGFLYAVEAYGLLRRKLVFLLPAHFVFKMIAWTFGFLNAQLRFSLSRIR